MSDPDRIGNYRILERIGRGGAGLTYLAVSDASTHESTLLACIKTPHPRFATDPAYLEDFENEARFASTLAHPHIVALRERGVDARGVRYLVYAFVEGLDLNELIEGVRGKRQQLDWSLVATVATQMARALEYAHQDSRGSGRLTQRPPVIHRDICPQNILIGLSGVSYLTDFGIAKAAEGASIQPSLSGSGRLAYSAPERLVQGGGYDARADLFSLGVVLFEALTNERPYNARTSATYLKEVLSERRPRVEDRRAEYHASTPDPSEGLQALVAIVHRLLEPNPDDRYASAAKLVDDLSRIRIPPRAHRELVMAAEDHMPEWRRNVRLRSGEMPEVRLPIPREMWSRTDPQQLTDLLEGERFDAERDTIRLSPEGARRLLAHRHTPLTNTRPGYAPDPGVAADFDTTEPDRPAFDFEVGAEAPPPVVLTPPPFIDAFLLDDPAIPETRSSRPAFDPRDLAAAATGSEQVGGGGSHGAPIAVEPVAPKPSHAHVVTGLPAYDVNGAGELTPVPPRRARSIPRWLPWALGAIALAVLPCVVVGLVAAMAAAVAGHERPTLGGSPRVGSGGGTSSEVFTWLGPYPPALVDLDGDGYRDAIGFTWDFGGTDAVSAISGADASVLWVHPAEQDLTGDFNDVRVWVPSSALVVFADLRGVTIGIDTSDGSERWRAELGARALRACRVESDLLITTSDRYTYRVALSDGSMQRTRAPTECEAVPRVAENRLQVIHSMPGWERARPRELPWPREQVRGCWLAPEGDRYLAEIRHPGPLDRDIVEIVAVHTNGDLLWQQPATEDWDRAQNWGVRHLAVEDGAVFAVYDMVRGRSDVPRRIAAFDYETGRRLWDAPLEWQSNNVDFVLADARRVYVGHWALEILDRADGRSIGRVGVFPNEHH